MSIISETMLVSFQCHEVPGVKILTYNGPIYYGNRSFFREEMGRLLGLTPEKIRSWEKARKALEKREREAAISTVVRKLTWNIDNKVSGGFLTLKCIEIVYPSQLICRKEVSPIHLSPRKMSFSNQVREAARYMVSEHTVTTALVHLVTLFNSCHFEHICVCVIK